MALHPVPGGLVPPHKLLDPDLGPPVRIRNGSKQPVKTNIIIMPGAEMEVPSSLASDLMASHAALKIVAAAQNVDTPPAEDPEAELPETPPPGEAEAETQEAPPAEDPEAHLPAPAGARRRRKES